MSSQVRILGIAGSLRRGSYNQAALRAAKLLVPENVEIDIFQPWGTGIGGASRSSDGRLEIEQDRRMFEHYLEVRHRSCLRAAGWLRCANSLAAADA